METRKRNFARELAYWLLIFGLLVLLTFTACTMQPKTAPKSTVTAKSIHNGDTTGGSLRPLVVMPKRRANVQ
jgi:hypothetical protein